MRFHIQKNLKEDERLYISHELIGLNPSNPPIKPEEYIGANEKYFKNLVRKKREKLKVIYGHYVTYGIHKYFDKPARYFTFLRNPIEQVMSLYKYLVYLYYSDLPDVHKTNNFEKILIINKKIQNFSRWLKIKYNLEGVEGGISTLSMLNTLKLYGFIANKNIIKEPDIIDALKKFYFIGSKENYNEESLYLYSKMGFNKYFFDQNIIKNQIEVDLSKEDAKKYLEKHDPENMILFDLALEKNQRFKEENPDYSKTVRFKKYERRLLLPITQTIYSPRNTLIRIYKSIFEGSPISSKT